MQKYLGVKIIEAKPMSDFDFRRSKGMTPSDEETDREGYQVVYPDGYVSWSPKDVFEKAYKEVLKDANDKLGLLVDTKTSEWEILGHVAQMEFGSDDFRNVDDSDLIELTERQKK